METEVLDQSLVQASGSGRLLFERFMARLGHGDLESLLDLFAEDAEILDFDGCVAARPK